MRSARGMLWAWIGIIVVAGAILYSTYGTLEPCGMFQGEVQRRMAKGDVDILSEVPGLVANNRDQLYCAKAMGRMMFQ